MEYDRKRIGRRVQEARKAKHYTQDYVSAQINIGEKFLSQIECGKAGLSVPTLIALCNVLDVSPNYLLLSDIPDPLDDPLRSRMRGLTPQQVEDAERILDIFIRNCHRVNQENIGNTGYHDWDNK